MAIKGVVKRSDEEGEFGEDDVYNTVVYVEWPVTFPDMQH